VGHRQMDYDESSDYYICRNNAKPAFTENGLQNYIDAIEEFN